MTVVFVLNIRGFIAVYEDLDQALGRLSMPRPDPCAWSEYMDGKPHDVGDGCTITAAPFKGRED